MKDSKIDYSKLNDRIVEQAFRSAFPAVLSAEDKQKLIDEKIERARLLSESLQKVRQVA